MNSAEFRFYAELNDFLQPARRQVAFVHAFDGRPAIKDTIEALGVPHPEVELILVDGESVDFAHPLEDRARVSVYPIFESLDITPIVRVRPQPLRETRFVLDTHLGRLAAYLRMLGFDTLYRNDYRDSELAGISARERRVLLTRDRGLLRRSAVTRGYCVRHDHPREQLAEVVRRFDLVRSMRPFGRCMLCNDELKPVDPDAVRAGLPPRVRELHTDFRACRGCGRVYWKGSHYERMQELIRQTIEASRAREG